MFAGNGWSEGQRSLALLTLAVGGLIGFGLNFHQEKLYARQTRKHGGKPPAEARLFYACGGAVLAPIGLFIFAWTGRPSVNPAGPIIGLLLFNSAIYPIYLGKWSFSLPLGHICELHLTRGFLHRCDLQPCSLTWQTSMSGMLRVRWQPSHSCESLSHSAVSHFICKAF